MICPACGNNLVRMKISDIEIDVCKGGCGGIWFDLFELNKVDEKHESAGESLLDIERDPSISIDPKKRRKCPKCKNVVMMQHFFSVKRDVVVDECPKCGGFWLDCGELSRIRSQFESEEERNKAADEYVKEIAGSALEKMRKESEEKLHKAQQISKMFKFICPSYYIPGKQNWGAF